MDVQQQQWVQRQACIAFRNLVSRCKEHRKELLAIGVEGSIRQAKRNFPAACQDVGAAALRDLGCEEYDQ